MSCAELPRPSHPNRCVPAPSLSPPPQVRKAFRADVAAGKTLVVADYGQLELRILAHMAGCVSMIRAVEAGECCSAHHPSGQGMWCARLGPGEEGGGSDTPATPAVPPLPRHPPHTPHMCPSPTSTCPGGDFHSRTALGMYDHIKEAIDKGGWCMGRG